MEHRSWMLISRCRSGCKMSAKQSTWLKVSHQRRLQSNHENVRALLLQVKQAAIPATKAITCVSPAVRRKVLPTAGAATAGVAVAAWTDAPVLRNVLSFGENVKQAACRSVSWMGSMARGAATKEEPRLLRLPFRRRASQTALALH